MSITGANTGYQDANSIELVDGRFLMAQDIKGNKNVAVISDKTTSAIFGEEDPLEQEIKVCTDDQILTYTVISVYQYESGGMMGSMVAEEDVLTSLYIPVSMAQKLSGSGKSYQSFTLVASTNIILVSVTERTREIGTRKALGARSSAIRMQFVVESIIICLIGGLIGVIPGIIPGNVGSALLGFPATASTFIIVVAALFPMAIGMFCGYCPASKAAKPDPIEALRYE